MLFEAPQSAVLFGTEMDEEDEGVRIADIARLNSEAPEVSRDVIRCDPDCCNCADVLSEPVLFIGVVIIGEGSANSI